MATREAEIDSSQDVPGEEPLGDQDTDADFQRRLRARRVRATARAGATTLASLMLVVTINFFLPRLAPGDPVTAMLATGGSGGPDDKAVRQRVASYYGLDRPMGEQYLRYLGGIVRGDLGESIRYNRPVTSLLAERLPWTLLLTVTGTLIASTAGIVAGISSGWRAGRALDKGLLALFLGIRNFPVFFLGSLALFVFGVKLRWVPLGGGRTIFADSYGPLRQALDIAHHLVLPALIFSIPFAAGYFLQTRGSMEAELEAGYLEMGKAKGLTERRLKYAHAARNAMLPVAATIAVQFGGAVILSTLVEVVFAYPGVGRLAFDSLAFRDYPALQGTFLFFSVTILAANFFGDVVARRLDPRVGSQ